MKLIKLEIDNIASYAHATVDFAAAPLATAPVFLIAGDVGSGKSTILDCITLALYAKTPRMESTRMKGRSGDSGRDNTTVRPNDVRQLIRLGSGKASVCLIFEDEDGRRYTSRWEAHITRNGTYAQPKRYLTLPDGTELSRVGDIEKRIADIVGLDFEQFCRTTMLAQGEFTRFLKAEDKNKADILEKITGTGIYARISSRIYRHATESAAKADEIRRRIAELTGDTNGGADSAAIDAQITATQKLAQTLKDEKARLQSTATFRESLAQAANSLDKARESLLSAQEYSQSDAVKEARTTIDRLKTAAPALEMMSERERLGKEMHDCNDRIAHARNDFAALLSQRAETDRKLRQATTRRDENMQALSALDAWLPLIEKADNIRGYITRAISALDSAHNARERLADATARLSQLNDKHAKTERQLADARLHAEKAVERSDYIDKRSEAYSDIPRLTIELGKAHAKLVEIQSAERHMSEKRAHLAQLQEKARKLATDIAADKTLGEELSQALARAEGAAETARDAFDRFKDTVADHSKTLRATLTPGCQCPVCRQKVVTMPPDDAILTELYLSLKTARDKTRDEHLRIRNELERVTIRSEQQRKDSDETESNIGKLQTEIDKLADEQQKAVSKLADELRTEADAKVIGQVISEQQTQLSARSASLDTLKKLSAKAIVRMQKARTAADKLARELEADERAISELSGKVQALIQVIDSESAKAETETKALNKASSGLFGEIATQTDKKRLADISARFEEKIGEHKRLSGNISELELQIEKLRQEYSESSESINDIVTLLPDFASVSEGDSQKMTSDPSGRKLVALLTELTGQQDNKKSAIAKLNQQIDSFIHSNKDFSIERLAELHSLDKKHIDEYRRLCENADKEISLRKVLVAEAQKNLDRLQADSGRYPSADEIDDESLRALAEEKNSQYDQTLALLGELRKTRDDYRKIEEKLAGLRASLAEATAIADEWAGLNEALGSASGDKFRTIAQSFVLQSLLDSANIYMRRLSGRYILRGQPGNFNIDVVDTMSGGASRSANTVSGGESFMVSLALALALCDISPRLAVDILFIDEGFGTLSGQPLVNAVELLRSLHRSSGRRVGIISHIGELKSCIETRIMANIDPRSGTTSLTIEGAGMERM